MDILPLAIKLVAELDGFREHVVPGSFRHCLKNFFIVMDQQQIFHEAPPAT